MTRVNDPSSPNQDERLAQFTEQVLKGQIKEIEANVDEEMRDLEETILRLNKAIPPASLDDASVKQMLVRLKARTRKEGASAKSSFWERWFGAEWRSGLSGPQFGMAFSAIAMLLLIMLIIPSFISSGSSTTATALNHSGNLIAIVVLVGIIFFIFWTSRRK